MNDSGMKVVESYLNDKYSEMREKYLEALKENFPVSEPELRIGIKRYNKSFVCRVREWLGLIFDEVRHFPRKSGTHAVLLKPGDDGYYQAGFTAVYDKEPFRVRLDEIKGLTNEK